MRSNQRERIYFYNPRDPWGCLSNFSRHSFVLSGYRWPTAEHFYQASKCVPGGEDYMKIYRASTPREAKRLGGQVELPDDWDTRRIDVMRTALHAKFTQNIECKYDLLSSDDAILIEDSPRDYFWGCGEDGTGQNMLGNLLMELREHFRDRGDYEEDEALQEEAEETGEEVEAEGEMMSSEETQVELQAEREYYERFPGEHPMWPENLSDAQVLSAFRQLSTFESNPMFDKLADEVVKRGIDPHMGKA